MWVHLAFQMFIFKYDALVFQKSDILQVFFPLFNNEIDEQDGNQ